jgi:hypothetical protein
MNQRAMRTLITSLLPVISFVIILLLISQPILISEQNTDATANSTVAPESVYASAIRLGDLPPGWREGGRETEYEMGMEGRVVWFHRWRVPEIMASEKLLVYPTPISATQAYSSLRDKYFPPDYIDFWKQIPELEIDHSADEMKIACMPPGTLPHFVCRMVARYRNTIVVVIGNVDEYWLRMTDFRSVLEAVDRRLIEALRGSDREF